jgi:hypothetical protein
MISLSRGAGFERMRLVEYYWHWRLFVRQSLITLGFLEMISVKYIGAFCGEGVHFVANFFKEN